MASCSALHIVAHINFSSNCEKSGGSFFIIDSTYLYLNHGSDWPPWILFPLECIVTIINRNDRPIAGRNRGLRIDRARRVDSKMSTLSKEVFYKAVDGKTCCDLYHLSMEACHAEAFEVLRIFSRGAAKFCLALALVSTNSI